MKPLVGPSVNRIYCRSSDEAARRTERQSPLLPEVLPQVHTVFFRRSSEAVKLRLQSRVSGFETQNQTWQTQDLFGLFPF